MAGRMPKSRRCLNPASIQDVLDYGSTAGNMSRYSGRVDRPLALAERWIPVLVVNIVPRPASALSAALLPSCRKSRRPYAPGANTSTRQGSRLRQLQAPAANQAYVARQLVSTCHPAIGQASHRRHPSPSGSARRRVSKRWAAIRLNARRGRPSRPHGFKGRHALAAGTERRSREFCAGLETAWSLSNTRVPLIEDQLQISRL